jgi:hypothetical protein
MRAGNLMKYSGYTFFQERHGPFGRKSFCDSKRNRENVEEQDGESHKLNGITKKLKLAFEKETFSTINYRNGFKGSRLGRAPN